MGKKNLGYSFIIIGAVLLISLALNLFNHYSDYFSKPDTKAGIINEFSSLLGHSIGVVFILFIIFIHLIIIFCLFFFGIKWIKK